MKVLYTAIMTAQGGRDGHVESPDGIFKFDLSMPKALGGAGGDGINPELLFAAGYSACFDSAMRFVAMKQKIKLTTTSVTANVSIGPKDGGGFQLAVELKVSLPDLTANEAKALVDAAHQVCPYSNATRGNVQVTLTVV